MIYKHTDFLEFMELEWCKLLAFVYLLKYSIYASGPRPGIGISFRTIPRQDYQNEVAILFLHSNVHNFVRTIDAIIIRDPGYGHNKTFFFFFSWGPRDNIPRPTEESIKSFGNSESIDGVSTTTFVV